MLERLWPDLFLHFIPGLIVYQILGTMQHELAHAVAFLFAGYGINKLKILPGRINGRWYWGYVTPFAKPGAHQTIHMHLAPYYVDILKLISWIVMYTQTARPWIPMHSRLDYHVWVAFTMFFLVSPLVDMIYNLMKLWLQNRGDFRRAINFLELRQ